MKIYNTYIITVASLMLLTTVILVGLGQTNLAIYYSLDIVEALVVTELFIHFSARARRALNLVSVVLFVGVLVAMSQQVSQFMR